MRCATPMCVILGLFFSAAVLADELAVLTTPPGERPPGEMLYRDLSRLAYAALDEREARFEALKTPEQIADYQAEMKAFFTRQLGGRPEKTPLNARVVGTLDKGDYRVEKILFESRPGFHVTGLLFLPQGKGRFPACIMPCGHSQNGKESEAYQSASILLARHGIASFLYDPIGQGERYQLLENGKPVYGPVMEHTVVGAGSILVGLSTASYRVWDGIRAIDYLCSREDVDAQRIGCTGNSGGGTLTSYLMALDERIVCAAPSCYLVGFRTLIGSIGPQDAEQNIFGQLAGGMDHSDYVLMRAPRPTLLLCATEDFFGIQGTWGLYREAKRLYGRQGYPERVSLVEAEMPHGFSKTLREGMVRWMRRWLLGIDDVVTEPEKVVVLTTQEVRCTPDGQVMLLPGERSVFEINLELAERLGEQRRRLWSESSKAAGLAKVRQVAGIRPLAELPEASLEKVGELARPGYRIDKLVLRPQEGIALPVLAFVPTGAVVAGDAYVYLHGEGKQVDAAAGGAIEKLVLAGHVVLAADLRGLGETAPPAARYKELAVQFGRCWQESFLAYMLGRTLVGMRAEDAMVVARLASTYETGSVPRGVRLVAKGECAIPALHAAALEPDRFASVAIEDVPTWSQLLRTPQAKGQLERVVHGVLGAYDLDDLRASIPASRRAALP